jgi:hypothetical protein
MRIRLGDLRRLIINEYSDAACRYEGEVIKSLKVAGANGYMKRAACSDASRPDADMKVEGEVYYVEVKLDSNARMGGGSVGYSASDMKFFAAGQNRDLSETVVALLNDMNDTSLHKGLRKFLQVLSKVSGKQFNGVPISGFTGQAWATAKDMGLLQAINRSFDSSIDVIRAHYAKKDTHYIQIGGAGFFHLGSNPANLPVPQLEGRVRLEVQLSMAGGKEGSDKRAAGMRVWARLKINGQSPYSIDNPESVEEMLAAAGAQPAPAAKPAAKKKPRAA